MEEKINDGAKELQSPGTNTFDSSDGGKIDFEGIRTLNRETMKPDPFFYRLGRGFVELLLRLFLLILQVVFDVAKALVQVVVGVFKGLVWLVKWIGRFLRGKYRILREGDWLRRANFLFNGIGYAKSKQWGNMIVFLCVEALFIFFMVFVGSNAINEFIHIGDLSQAQIDAVAHDVSVRRMVLGIMTFFIIVGYCFVWNKGVQGGYDMYQIERLYEYKAAHKDAMHVLSHQEDFEEDLTKMPSFKIRRLMRKKYGYSELSSAYISYIPFKRIKEREPWFGMRLYLKARSSFYGAFCRLSEKISRSTWHTIFAKYLTWKPKPYVAPYGIKYVEDQVSGSYYRFLHTYDKYNDYLRHVRDRKAVIEVLSDPHRVYDCVCAQDAVSVRSGLEAVDPFDPKTKLQAKVIASRIVGAFECGYDIALVVARYAVNAVKSSALTKKKSGEEVSPIAILKSKRDSLQESLDEFIDENKTRRERMLDATKEAYSDPSLLFEMAENGRSSFLNQLLLEYDMPKSLGAKLYAETRLALKESDPEGNLAMRLAHFEEFASLYEETPFHPAPVTFSKQLKSFGDERFAVTVMALPTLGALLVTVIPLIFSILLAFTNWDTIKHGDGNFSWSNSGFTSLFGMGDGNSLMPKTFVSLLVWTLVWAVFATFLNYIFGIVLALLIQRKGIKGKGVWRTLFVISIAVPQFITLLVISKFFGDQGPFNSWLGSFTTGMQVPAADGEFITAYYVGSGTPEDPYRIVGSQGILGWLSGWKDWNGNSLVSGVKTLVNYVKSADGTIHEETLTYVTSDCYIGFFSNSAWGGFDVGNLLTVRAVLPKINIILINCWIGIPYTMLSTAGILMNIPEDLYESSRIDGASSWTQFWKITMPYVLFVTGPSLLTQFIGNINNFNVIYFLTGGGPDSQLALTAPAGFTDLLITWIYKISVTNTNKQYYLASAIGCVIFLICAFFSLLMYSHLGSTKNEEEFQ